MITGRLTSGARTTIPQPVRMARRLHPGDETACAIGGDRIVPTRARPDRAGDGASGCVSEWDIAAATEAHAGLSVVGAGAGPVPSTKRPAQQRRPAPARLRVLMVTRAAGLPAAASVGRPAQIATIATIEARDAEPIASRPLATGARWQPS